MVMVEGHLARKMCLLTDIWQNGAIYAACPQPRFASFMKTRVESSKRSRDFICLLNCFLKNVLFSFGAFQLNRNDNRNVMGMNIFVSSANYFPFCTRRSGYAKCIIANNTIEARSVSNGQHGYENIHQGGHGARDCYILDLQHQDHSAEYQANTIGSGGLTIWPRQDPFTSLCERGPTSTLAKIDHRDITAKLHEPRKVLDRCQMVTASAFDSVKSCSRLQNEKTVKGNETKIKSDSGNGWPCPDNWNAFQLQREPHLSNIHPNNSVKELQDPRLKTFHDSDPIYHGWNNFVPAKTLGTPEVEGCGRPAMQTSASANGFQHNSIQPTWWNDLPISQCRFIANTSSNYQETRSTVNDSGSETSVCKPSEEWQIRTRETQQQTPRFTDHGVTNRFFIDTELSNSQNDQSVLRPAKSRGSSEEVVCSRYYSQEPVTLPSKSKLESQSFNFSDEEKDSGATTYFERETGQLNSHLQTGKPPEFMTNPKECEDYQETKISETYDREKRIRSLKALLKKHERALEALRHKMKTPVVISEKEGNINNIPFKGDHTRSFHALGNIAVLEDFPSIDGGVDLRSSLKRKWLENWNEDDTAGLKSTNNKKGKEDDLSGVKYEEEDKDLNSAEFTAVEGLVRLNKD